MKLTPKQRQFLKAEGHHLEPLVQVGKEGLSEAWYAAMGQALLDHELIKVRLGKNAPLEMAELLAALARGPATVVAHLGNVVLLYAPHPEKPRLILPSARSGTFE